MFKERTGDLVYGLYANRNTERAGGRDHRHDAGSQRQGRHGKLPLGTSLDAPGDDLRRRGPAPLRERRRRSADRATAGPIATSRPARCGSAATRSGREWFDGRIDEVRVYNRALTQAEIQTDMRRASRATRRRRRSRRRRRPQRRHRSSAPRPTVTATFSEAMDPATITTDDLRAPRPGEHARARRRSAYDATTAQGDAPTRRRPALRHDLHGDGQGRRDRQRASRTWPATPSPPTTRGRSRPSRRRRRSCSSRSSDATSSARTAAEILRAEGLNELRDARRRRSRSSLLYVFDVVVLGDVAARRAAEVTHADELGERRRQPDRLRPGQAARGPARAHRRGRHARERVHAASTRDRRQGPGSSGETMQFHGTADRYTLNGATRGRHALLERAPRRRRTRP